MNTIRALVVDDEEHSRGNVRALLRSQPSWQVVGECDGVAALSEAIARGIPDVVFLDVRMPGADGIVAAEMLRRLDPQPLVVFTTAYEEYAVSAFNVQAIDYLLKPFDDARFHAALRRVEQALRTPRPMESGDATQSHEYAQRVVIRSIGRVQFVDVSQIDWLEASGNYVEIHAGKESFLHRERLHVLEAQLDPADFVRIHRSIIVNRAAVKEIRPIAGGDCTVLLRDGAQVRLSRTYRSALQFFERGA